MYALYQIDARITKNIYALYQIDARITKNRYALYQIDARIMKNKLLEGDEHTREKKVDRDAHSDPGDVTQGTIYDCVNEL